ncbi:MAG: hypothetical protein C4321_08910, partial [Chloroflexota bacterium]
VGGDTTLGLPQTLPSSVYPAVQNLLLAATALGLGSAMTTLALRFAEDLRHLTGLPAHVTPMAVVPIGWPARRLGPPRRLPLAATASRGARRRTGRILRIRQISLHRHGGRMVVRDGRARLPVARERIVPLVYGTRAVTRDEADARA